MERPQSAPRKAPTLRDVAREAGVSVAAASYSLSGGGTIGEEVRARVRQVAERIGYRPNRSAQAVRTGRTMSLGLIIPDLNNPYYPAIAQSVERAARQAGYTVVLIDTSGSPEDEIEAMRHLETHGVAGAVWCQTATQPAGEAGDYQVPIVVIGSPRPSFDNVTADDDAGGRLAARHLLELGHRRVGILAGASVPEGLDHRRTAFVAEMQGRANIVWDLKTPYSIDLDEAAIARLARREVTAVMCGNDLIAIGVLRAALQLGIAVPQELSVVGFDDIPWAAIVSPELTTIHQPVAEIAATAMTLLLDRIAEPDRTVRHFKVGVRLVRRDSAVAAPAGSP
ncbi:MAG: LacI family DNA-binding transcriptional regulator [Devosia sp.]|nr:LacI family DNA-binding transcriptional regulator [Devosia sp.]